MSDAAVDMLTDVMAAAIVEWDEQRTIRLIAMGRSVGHSMVVLVDALGAYIVEARRENDIVREKLLGQRISILQSPPPLPNPQRAAEAQARMGVLDERIDSLMGRINDLQGWPP